MERKTSGKERCQRSENDPGPTTKQRLHRLMVRKRDRAHREIKNIFFKVIQKRRSSGETVDDFLQTLIDATYK